MSYFIEVYKIYKFLVKWCFAWDSCPWKHGEHAQCVNLYTYLPFYRHQKPTRLKSPLRLRTYAFSKL